MLWAWERPEDLRFVDPAEFGVAYLAQTLTLKNDRVIRQPRHQPLQVTPGTYLVAVTRIESGRESAAPALNVEQRKKIVEEVKKTIELPDVRSVQIDFDALLSERQFYADLINAVKNEIPENFPLSITALTSWCSGDRWLSDLPIDGPVPMVFDMGPDEKAVVNQIAGGDDWAEPACRNSYGVSLDTKPVPGLKNGRQMYYFKSTSWQKRDLETIKNFHDK